ncbi:hypothetical protein D8S78_11200 [Natrialba swarupiae]|nr:hypothetical protein [Natrialba swarupiae]
MTIVAWLPFPAGLWIATVGTDLGNVAVHEDRSAHSVRTRVYRRARYLALGIALLSAVVATIYVLVATLGVLGGALVGIAVFVLGSEWVEPHSLAQSGTLREPTENERRRLETLLADARRSTFRFSSTRIPTGRTWGALGRTASPSAAGRRR